MTESGETTSYDGIEMKELQKTVPEKGNRHFEGIRNLFLFTRTFFIGQCCVFWFDCLYDFFYKCTKYE
jgi:hypothetical protein